MFKVGGNAMFEQIALRFGFFVYARVVADLGTDAFAAHQICAQFLSLSLRSPRTAWAWRARRWWAI